MHLQTRLNCSLGLSSSPCLCLSPLRAELRTESRLFFLLARPAEARLRPPTRIISHIAQGGHGGVAQRGHVGGARSLLLLDMDWSPTRRRP